MMIMRRRRRTAVGGVPLVTIMKSMTSVSAWIVVYVEVALVATRRTIALMIFEHVFKLQLFIITSV